MTRKELLTSIVSNSPITAEMIECAQSILDADAKHAASAASKRKDKTASANAELVATLSKTMEIGKAYTAAEIVALGIDGITTTSKATVVAKGLPSVVVGSTKVKGRSVKTYTL